MTIWATQRCMRDDTAHSMPTETCIIAHGTAPTLMTATSLKKVSMAFSVSGGGGGAMPASTSLFASVALKLRAPPLSPPCVCLT